MSDAIERLAQTLLGFKGGNGGIVMGKVISKQPIRVLAEGNAQDGDSLLRSDSVDITDIRAGDVVALWPIEDHQRYVILTKVVEL